MEPYDENSEAQSSESLKQSVKLQQALFQVVIAALIVLSASFSLVLYRQVRNLQRQVMEANRYLVDYEARSLPAMTNLVVKLEEYSKTHPDFTPILRKYVSTNAMPVQASAK